MDWPLRHDGAVTRDPKSAEGVGEWRDGAYVQSWAPQIRLVRRLSLGFTIVAAWAAIWFTAWWVFGDDWPTGPMPGAAWIGAGLSIALFGVIGIGGLRWTRRIREAGIRIDAGGVTAHLAVHTLRFSWSEVGLVELRVQRRIRPATGGWSPAALRTTTGIQIALAPARGSFSDRDGLEHHAVNGREPYTHVIGTIPSGPISDSADRIGGMDQALAHFAGSRYAGLVEDEISW